jgi:ferredoxin
MSCVDTKLLRKERLEDFLNGLIRDYTVLGPVQRGAALLMGPVASAGELCLDRGHTKNSAKAAFFPQAERLFSYRRTDAGEEIRGPSPDERPVALVGVRPCDAAGLLLLDRVFGGGIRDPYYSDRRARGIVIAMACNAPGEACFCHVAGGGPHSAAGADLLFVACGRTFVVSAGSPKGMMLLDDAAMEEADDETLAAAALVRKEAEDAMSRAGAGHTPLDADFADHLERLFDDPVWSDIAESCLGCGICTYLCPTCHCFDICDEADATSGERLRIWDSCQFPLFTCQASGVNPRPSARERIRQRIMHKFCYLPRNENLLGCVGCGRCVSECPVNLDIREVLERLSTTAVG